MKKNEELNKWLWKWHFIAGLISLPFILIISITGVIYLFEGDYEGPRQKSIREVVVNGPPISFEQQWNIAKENAVEKPNAMIIPESETKATEFISGKLGHITSTFIDPYKKTVSGNVIPKHSLMYKARKLHGELLLGKFGTKIVELVASWMVVLIFTGLFIWWPGRGWQLKGFFIPRIRAGRRTFFRDMHAITGFWISILLLMVLAGGFPWTDVFGDNFKWFQKVTNTGYPATWNAKNLESDEAQNPIALDNMITIAKALELSGEVSIDFPKGKKGVYSVSNATPDLSAQKKYHFDQYTGKQLLKHNWRDVGVLMRGRMWVMAFHQGQFGRWNWILMLLTGIALATMSISALVSYLKRKQKGNWGVPLVPEQFKAGYGIVIILGILSIVFPLFGISLLCILLFDFIKKKRVTGSN